MGSCPICPALSPDAHLCLASFSFYFQLLRVMLLPTSPCLCWLCFCLKALCLFCTSPLSHLGFLGLPLLCSPHVMYFKDLPIMLQLYSSAFPHYLSEMGWGDCVASFFSPSVLHCIVWCILNPQEMLNEWLNECSYPFLALPRHPG